MTKFARLSEQGVVIVVVEPPEQVVVTHYVDKEGLEYAEPGENLVPVFGSRPGQLSDMFHPDLAPQFVLATDEVQCGWIAQGSGFLPPDTATTIHVDANGGRWTSPGEGRTPVSAAFSAPLVCDVDGQWRAETDEDRARVVLCDQRRANKAEAARRILAVADLPTQMNMAASRAAGVMGDKEKGLYVEFLSWLHKTREAAAQDEPAWPDAPVVDDLTKNY